MSAVGLLSVHLAPGARAGLALLRARPPASTPGLLWAETMVAAPLPAAPLPRPSGAALVAGWRDDAALDAFLARAPLAGRPAEGWHARLEPLRAYGRWPALPGLGEPERPVDDDEPVAVVTLGRLRGRRAAAFLRASGPAEAQAAADPAVELALGLVRPPQLFGTLSLWRTARAMRDYAVGRSGDAHLRATRAHLARPFHHESVFARFRPYAMTGRWQGRAPLGETAAAGA